MSYFFDHYDAVRYPTSLNGGAGLRNAQIGAIHAIASYFTVNDKAAKIIMPTGSGKSGVLILAPFVLRSRRALVITPSRLVRRQIKEEIATLRVLKDAGALPKGMRVPRVVEVEKKLTTEALWNALHAYDVVVGTPNSISPGVHGVVDPPRDLFDLVLVDEAHHSPARTWNTLLAHFSDAKHVLFTATPSRRDNSEIKGDFVFVYPLKKAVEDGIFGKVEYVPVEPTAEGNDVAIARRAQTVFQQDRDNGFQHLMMVRTETKKRAQDLAIIYETHTSLRLELVTSDQSYTRVKETIRRLRNLEIDGIICVDMLGEGFDLPKLKIAAIHAPHKSLEITLQFIGRFARTNDPLVGPAKFLAVPAEIEIEKTRLYREDALWQDLIVDMSSSRIEREVLLKETLEGFQDVGDADFTNKDLSLYALRPYHHVKVYEVTGDVNIETAISLPHRFLLPLHKVHPELSATIFVTREKQGQRWTTDEDFSTIAYHLFIVYFDEAAKLLFICASSKKKQLYEQIASLFSPSGSRPVPLYRINKVLHDLKNFEVYNFGLRNPTLHTSSESYRNITGPDALRSVDQSDSGSFQQGHFFGSADESGNHVTIGYSSSGKAWSNTSSLVPDLIVWCKKLACRLDKDEEISTGSVWDQFSCGEEMTALPDNPLTALWDEDAFRRSFEVAYQNREGIKITCQLLDLDLFVDRDKCSRDSLRVVMTGDDLKWEIDYTPFSGLLYTPLEDQALLAVTSSDDHMTMGEYLQTSPLHFFFADYTKAHGRTVHPPRMQYKPFASERIEAVDWAAENVDIQNEFEMIVGEKKSIHCYLRENLTASNADVVFYDHGSGEVADFVTFHQTDRDVLVRLFHCKGSGEARSGSRVADVYEVCGQAVKSTIWTRPKRLLTKIKARHRNNAASKFLKGDMSALESLMTNAKAGVVRYEIVLVQPGIRRDPLGENIADIIAATDAYVVRAQCERLRVIASG